MTLRSEPVLKARPLWLLFGWMLVFLIIYLSLTPDPVQMPMAAQWEGDKFGHGLAYATLMSWFASLYQAAGHRIRFAAGFIALGVFLEFAQRWTGYRSFEVLDMAASAAGVLLGWVFSPPRIPNCPLWVERRFQRN